MIDLAEDKRLQADEQERLKWAFDQLQIPLPTGNQHYHGGTRITFVTPAAVTIRLVQNKNTRLIRHPHVARPLGAIALSKRWRLDVIQGGETSVTHKEAKRIRDQLRKEGLNSSDIGEHKGDERNCFRIALKENFAFCRFPVAYDFHHLTLQQASARKLLIRQKPYAWVYDTRPNKDQMPDIQDRGYGDLRDAFMASWKSKSGKTIVSPDSMDRFWKTCIQAKAENRIVAAWAKEKSNFPPSQRQRLLAYQKRLQTESPAFS